MRPRDSSKKSNTLCLALLAVATSCGSHTSSSSKPPVPYEPGSPWPKFRGTAAQDGASTVRASAANSAGKPWSFQTERGIFSSPIIAADGTIYFGSADRNYYALNPDGTLKWKIQTGEIIDSAGLLDDRGRVYFGSGDGVLRAVDAKTGSVIWTMQADDPNTNHAFINWFEGNVAMGPSGELYVPNDNFFVYAVDRDTGNVTWRFPMPDQTWSLPAIDTTTETLFVGNNNLVAATGQNTYSIDKTGSANWAKFSLGTVAASPLLTPDGAIVVGGFDGYVHTYGVSAGDPGWQFATRDHIYASPARLPDGTLVQPSADGTVYGIDASNGATKWTFDAGEPIRSSPAIDGDGNIYFGGGDGRLYVLNKDGTLRWSMLLITDPRNDLNASPALGDGAVYIGGESGEMFGVPYDWCLHNAGDSRCATSTSQTVDGASFVFTSDFGDALPAGPTSIDADEPVTLALVVRKGGAAQLAILDANSVNVTVTPAAEVDTQVSGDGKFVTITPKSLFLPAADGTVTIDVQAQFLENMTRTGLRLSGGTAAGSVQGEVHTTLNANGADALDTSNIWEVSRLSIPLPTVMPSYNQIGFDSLHYLLGVIELTAGQGVAWMAGATLDAQNHTIVDPNSKAIIPLTVQTYGGVVSLTAQEGLQVQVMNLSLPFQSFRLATRLDPNATPDAPKTAALTGSAVCNTVPVYGPFLEQLGLCNPQTDDIRVLGAANVSHWGAAQLPDGVGTVAFTFASGAIVATLTGSSLQLSDHLVGILAIDPATGLPITLDYGVGTTRTTTASGALTTVTVPTTGATLPPQARVHLIVDSVSTAQATITLQ